MDTYIMDSTGILDFLKSLSKKTLFDPYFEDCNGWRKQRIPPRVGWLNSGGKRNSALRP